MNIPWWCREQLLNDIWRYLLQNIRKLFLSSLMQKAYTDHYVWKLQNTRAMCHVSCVMRYQNVFIYKSPKWVTYAKAGLVCLV